MRYLSGQPANPYFKWQLQVMLHNFVVKCGISPELIDVVCSIEPAIPLNEFKDGLCDVFAGVNFYFYEDTRENKEYIPSIRPHIFAKHFAAHPEFEKEVFFFCDSDVVFTRPCDFSHLCQDDVWYASDTSSYIGASYIKSKGDHVYANMCSIVGISPEVPEKNERHSGGAQWIMKKLTHAYWEKVERDSQKLYNFFVSDLQHHPHTDSYFPIQKWTAEMWAVLWNAWYFGNKVVIHPDLSFAWATDPIYAWENCSIYHNAGICQDMSTKYFCKCNFLDRAPFDEIHPEVYDENLSTRKYAQEISETKTFIDLVK